MAGLEPALLANLEYVIGKTTNKMRFKRRLGDWSAGNDHDEKDWFIGREMPNALLHYIQESAWNRLIGFSRESKFDMKSEQPLRCEIDKIPDYIGERRHFLFDAGEGYAFATGVLKKLNLTEESYIVVVKGNDRGITEMLRTHGFKVNAELEASEAGKGVRLEPFPDQYRGGVHLKKYWGVIIRRKKNGMIRNSYEFAVAFLAFSVLLAYRGHDF